MLKIWLWATRRISLRSFIGLIALGHGIARLNPFGNFTSIPLQFGTDYFAIFLTLGGIMLLLTQRYRLSIWGRLVAVCVGAVYATLGFAIAPSSSGSAIIDGLLTLALFSEAATHE